MKLRWKNFFVELVIMLAFALVFSVVVSFLNEGKVDRFFIEIIIWVVVLLVCIPRLVSTLFPRKRFSRKELKKMNALAEGKRLKAINEMGWHWKVRGEALCRIDNKTGELIEQYRRSSLREVWAVNMGTGPDLEDLWLQGICNEREFLIGSELFQQDILDWFFTLENFNHSAYSDCITYSKSRKTLLWKAGL